MVHHRKSDKTSTKPIEDEAEVESATRAQNPRRERRRLWWWWPLGLTADAEMTTAPHATSGEGQTKLPDTVKVKSATESAKPSEGVARARCAAGGARPGKGKGQVKGAKESATREKFRSQYYRNPSRGFHGPVNTKRWSCSYDRCTAKKKKREERN